MKLSVPIDEQVIAKYCFVILHSNKLSLKIDLCGKDFYKLP
jgi:hypothetical protein